MTILIKSREGNSHGVTISYDKHGYYNVDVYYMKPGGDIQTIEHKEIHNKAAALRKYNAFVKEYIT